MSDELESKLVEYIDVKIAESPPDTRIEKFKLSIALLASIATLTASFMAFYASKDALSVKKVLDQRQLLLDENLRISSIHYKKEGAVSCGGIPLDEGIVWREYRKCMFGEAHKYNEELNFKDVNNLGKRIGCLQLPTVNQCYPKLETKDKPQKEKDSKNASE